MRRRGAIGAVGAVPGTLAAHPFDVIKMLQQVHGEGLLKTVAARAGTGGLFSCHHGVGAGVAQKVCTRGPMFLASELSTQTVQSATGLSRDSAVFFGSAISGYITGAAAAPAEWQKVQPGWRAQVVGCAPCFKRAVGPDACTAQVCVTASSTVPSLAQSTR